MSTLYIFVTTDRPDQYLNSIVHAILENRINRIVLLKIKRKEFEQISLNILRQNIIDLIRSLASGFYKIYQNGEETSVVDLRSKYSPQKLAEIQAKYQQCLSDNIYWDIKQLNYMKMKQFISECYQQNKSNIFDVTPVSKLFIADIFACCLTENVQNLYFFNLKTKPNFSEPWKMLVHHLQKNQDYDYVNLVETPVFRRNVKSILIRTTPLLISIIGTIIFVSLTLAATFILGNNNGVTQLINTIGVALGIVSFFLIYFPIRGQ